MDDLRKFIGRAVKDPHGRDLGRLVGLTSNIKGEISSASIELHNGEFAEFSSRHLLVSGMNLILMQEWVLEADELTRELDLLRRRDHALDELLISGDVDRGMYGQLKEQFRQARDTLLARSDVVIQKLGERLQRLEEQKKTIQSLMANNKMHYSSGEIDEEAYSLANESIQNGLKRCSSEEKNVDEAINKLIASRDSAEDVGVERPGVDEKPVPAMEEPGPPKKSIDLAKTSGSRDIVIVRMEP
ncbi:MAG: CdvA-like protein [Candidatus Bathyarchaeia archaeon]